jgi:hypothetical protein
MTLTDSFGIIMKWMIRHLILYEILQLKKYHLVRFGAGSFNS